MAGKKKPVKKQRARHAKPAPKKKTPLELTQAEVRALGPKHPRVESAKRIKELTYQITSAMDTGWSGDRVTRGKAADRAEEKLVEAIKAHLKLPKFDGAAHDEIMKVRRDDRRKKEHAARKRDQARIDRLAAPSAAQPDPLDTQDAETDEEDGRSTQDAESCALCGGVDESEE